jgi:hypothetical protein
MEIYIGLGVVAVLVIVPAFLRWRTSYAYKDYFGINPGVGTWDARESVINTVMAELVSDVSMIEREMHLIERDIEHAELHEKYDLINQLQVKLKELRDAKFDVEYACKIVARREGRQRAEDLLSLGDQHLKPYQLQRIDTKY